MSTLYNIREIKLSGKSINSVHVAPISANVWKNSNHEDRNNWSTSEIATMNALKNLTMTDKSVEYQYPDMLQNGTYYYDSEIIGSSGTTEYYREVHYNGVIAKNGTKYTLINEPETGIYEQFISSDKSLKIRDNQEFWIFDKITNLQTADEYELKLNSEYDLNNTDPMNVKISDSFKIKNTPNTIQLNMSITSSTTELDNKFLSLNDFKLLNSNITYETEIKLYSSTSTEGTAEIYEIINNPILLMANGTAETTEHYFKIKSGWCNNTQHKIYGYIHSDIHDIQLIECEYVDQLVQTPYISAKYAYIVNTTATIINQNDYDNNLVEITGPECTTIGTSAFSNYTLLVEANFPSCTSIETDAFRSCSSLVEANFPSCTSIGTNAFRSCTSLVEANFPSCTSIGTNAFASCTSLVEANFPSCTSIELGDFYGCTSLVEVNFPSCTSIGNSAFRSCESLSTLIISTLTTFGNNVFNGISDSALNKLKIYINTTDKTNAESTVALIKSKYDYTKIPQSNYYYKDNSDNWIQVYPS